MLAQTRLATQLSSNIRPVGRLLGTLTGQCRQLLTPYAQKMCLADVLMERACRGADEPVPFLAETEVNLWLAQNITVRSEGAR